MTLLDSQLFQRIDSAELLTWVQEQVSFLSLTVIVTHGHPTQAEEKSLNLTKFTEHFNNMSYWTRTIILQQPDAKVVTILMTIILADHHPDHHADHDDDHDDDHHDDNHHDDQFDFRSVSDT